MFEEPKEIKISNFERIPLKNRLAFQKVLMKIMLGERSSDNLQIEWADRYSIRVSNIIDDVNNAFIRELIMKDTPEEYKEASEVLIKILEGEEMGRAA
ncbi:MAG: hypothetical protein PHN69_00550 [Candidatus Pacebacteria bacterium]|nr:hypothetical protein [Candidatus Paceibacterota bacterium]